MAEPVSRLSCGDEHFDLSGLMSDEMARVKEWTGCKNRREFYEALRDEDPDAVAAAFTLAKRRAGETDARFKDTRVNLDELAWSRHIDGRTVEMVVEMDGDRPLIVQIDETGRPLRDDKGSYLAPTGTTGEKVGLVPLFDDDGDLRWRYTDSGEEVRPTGESATSGSTGSPTTAKKQRATGSASGTPTTSDT